MNKLLATAAVIMAALSPPAEAGRVWVSGLGNNSCGEYTRAAEDERKARPVDSDPSALYSDEYVRYSDYLTGFLAGGNIVSMANGSDGEVGFSQNAAGMLAWLENYCRRNPTDPFLTALIRLREYLADKHQ